MWVRERAHAELNIVRKGLDLKKCRHTKYSMNAWRTTELDVRRSDAFLKASCAPRLHLDRRAFLLSPNDFSTSSACKEINAMQYIANINASTSRLTPGRSLMASKICCCTVGACIILVSGFTFSRNACHNLKIFRGLGWSSMRMSLFADVDSIA